MAHPSAAFPKGFTYITGTTAVTPQVTQVGDYFTSILCVEAGTIGTLEGSGMYADTSETAGDVTALAMSAGMIIYGRFTSVTATDGKYIAYHA